MKNLISIVPYNSQWTLEFHRIGLSLREALGGLAERIDHIGSTAVPGLVAKDVIDIQVTVATLDADRLIRALAPLGYTLLQGIIGDHKPSGRDEPPEEWSKIMFREPQTQRRTNLHVRQAGRANQRYALLFRDYLRADVRVSGSYGLVKETLARLHPDDFEAYYDVKDPICDIIMAAAELWANETNYTFGPSDL
jgi:GrpB-like predicted nucleotidyltransferase (UPF0157 family)